MNYDLIIVGSGPAGIFTALELIKRGTKKKMLLIEKGKPVEKRHCPKAEVGHCVNCKPSCAITTGFSGAGAFSDGKLSLSYEVGGDLPMLIGEDFAQELINYTDKIYLEFGADTKIRLRPSYFPFTEPSAEMDISCNICGGKGCPFCKHTGWVEILGCGMVDPNVLESNGIDSKVYSGYALGMGIERITNLKYQVKDLRMFSENDTRFLKEFESAY